MDLLDQVDGIERFNCGLFTPPRSTADDPSPQPAFPVGSR
jgi:hypothetical protein